MRIDEPRPLPKVCYRRATGRHMLSSKFIAREPKAVLRGFRSQRLTKAESWTDNKVRRVDPSITGADIGAAPVTAASCAPAADKRPTRREKISACRVGQSAVSKVAARRRRRSASVQLGDQRRQELAQYRRPDYIWISDGIEILASEVCFSHPIGTG